MDLSITPVKPCDIPLDDAVILAAARGVIEESESWNAGGVYQDVKTYRSTRSDGSPWHCRVSQHALSFDDFWDKLGTCWMTTKKSYNDLSMREIRKVTPLKHISPTQTIWTTLYKFPHPISPRVFTILELTHLDNSNPRTGWVIHIPVDLSGAGDEYMAEQEDTGIRGYYTCVEHITELPDGKTKWRLVTSNAPGGSIPTFIAEMGLPRRISADVTAFMDLVRSEGLLVQTSEPTAKASYHLGIANILFYIGHLLFFWWPRSKTPTAAESKKEILRSSDRLLIGLRDPSIPGIIELAQPMSLSQLQSIVKCRLLDIPRMSQVLVTPVDDAPYWDSPTNVDLNKHVHEHHLDAPASYESFRKMVETLSKIPLDMVCPPWDIALIQRSEGGSVIFSRVHHAIADGRGVTDILMACVDEPRSSLISPPHTAMWGSGAFFSKLCDLLGILTAKAQPRTSIKCDKPLEVPALAWNPESLSIQHLKKIARDHGGGTVNDVLLTAVSGALRTYMQSRGDAVDSLNIFCKLPIDVLSGSPFRYSSNPDTPILGTHLGDVNVPIPVNLPSHTARYAAVHNTMCVAKSGFRPKLSAYIASRFVGLLSTPKRLKLVAQDAQTVSCYLSNMKGPTSVMHLDGVEVTGMRCIPLGLNNIGVAFAFYSYADKVNVALCADSALVPTPDVICRYFSEEVVSLAESGTRKRRLAEIQRVTLGDVSPQWISNLSSDYSVDLPNEMEDVIPALCPATSDAIVAFLAATRQTAFNVDTDFILHKVDYVRMNIPLSFAENNIPSISELKPYDISEPNDLADVSILERHHFTVIERVPTLFGLFKQSVRVTAWQVCDFERKIAAYETVLEGALAVRTWKLREFEDVEIWSDHDITGKKVGTKGTRVKETLNVICPWWLRSVVQKNSVIAHQMTMHKYASLVASSSSSVYR